MDETTKLGICSGNAGKLSLFGGDLNSGVATMSKFYGAKILALS